MEEQLSVDALRRIDQACDSFEEEWRQGKQPRLEEYLRRSDASVRARMLEALQKLQQELILEQLDADPSTVAELATRPSALAPATSESSSPSRPSPSSDDAAEKTLDWDGARVILRVIAGPHQGSEFVYDEHNTLLVGRGSQAQLRLKEDLHFSRNHFRLEINPPDCYLMDLRSRNGTFVNGDRVSDRFLKHGDVVSGGRTQMKVSIEASRSQVIPTPALPVEIPKAAVPIVPVSAVAPPASDPRTGPNEPRSQSAQKSAPDSEQTAVHIDGYQIHEQIGAGDLGKVYRATRQATGELCALKVISPAARADEKAIQSFLREAAILNQLQHANIVRMNEMGASGSELFMSTEFLATLDWQELSARWSPAQKIRIACGLMAQVLGALDYAHGRSLVHRDVKPGNILIFRSPDGKLAAKLADFGLAKQYTTAGMSQMTREGDVIGSLPFMSPEQFINSREAKPTCDIYSAGATLYWMLSGQEPIVLANHPCKFLAILEDPPVPLRQRCPDVPLALEQLVHRALEKTPEKRFGSTAEMRQQLRAFAK